jgi:hypothetical protein
MISVAFLITVTKYLEEEELFILIRGLRDISPSRQGGMDRAKQFTSQWPGQQPLRPPPRPFLHFTISQ